MSKFLASIRAPFSTVGTMPSTSMGVYAVLVDAIDDLAVQFYQRHSFETLESNPRTLFLPISDGLKRIAGS